MRAHDKSVMASNPCQFDELIGHLMHRKHAEAKNYLINVDRPSQLVDDRGATLLHHAVENNNQHMARYFLDLGLPVDRQDRKGQTPLVYAVIGWNDAMAKLLIEAGADIYKSDDCHETALKMALRSGRESLARVFLHQLRREHPSDEGLAAVLRENLRTLHPALYLRSPALTRILLEAGLRLQPQDSLFEPHVTPLGLAIRALDYGNVKLLVERGADVNWRVPGTQAPLDGIPNRNAPQKLEILRLLIDAGADLRRRMSANHAWNLTPYHAIFRYGTREMVRLLLRTDRDFFAANAGGLLARLALNRSKGAIEALRDVRYDANAPADRRGRTALHYAAEYGRASSVEFLLSEGAADVDAATRYDKSTALWSALSNARLCFKPKLRCLEALLEHGADPQHACLGDEDRAVTPLEVVARMERGLQFAKPLLAYIAVRERTLHRRVTPTTLSVVGRRACFKRYFQFCGKHIEIMGKTSVHGAVSMLDLLTKDVGWSACRVKNPNLSLKLTRLCNEHRMNVYYSGMLQKRVTEILNIVNIRREAADILDSIFGHFYRRNHLIVDKIVGFLSCQDLQTIVEASNLMT